MNPFVQTITSTDPDLRNRPFLAICASMPTAALLQAMDELEAFRHQTNNLYERVRACLFLYAANRFVLPQRTEIPQEGLVPPIGHAHLFARRFELAIGELRKAASQQGLTQALVSGLAEGYHQLSFQILADQVKKSVRSSKGNQWMFRVGHTDEYPLRIHSQLLERAEGHLLYPVLQEKTSVRMDLTHSGWSDIFFLGMDFPEGARVCNISVNLGVYGRDADIRPPIESYVRVIPEPVLRITSIDLGATKDVTDLADLFNFGNDYLSLLKAGIIASGVVPPSFEGTNHSLTAILEALVAPGMGLEVVTKVNDIPKGSRFAVSTNLLASMIAALMRATGQTENLQGQLLESERRLVASRAILGEWIGGSGGGWQDSGGIWPGIKAIQGALAQPGDPEYGISRGCLLPRHRVLQGADIHPDIDQKLSRSLLLMHGGMASNVGPILEMVTEKYLLRAEQEWAARQHTNQLFGEILQALKDGDIRQLAAKTDENFHGPLQTIIPWATNHFTETIIAKAKKAFGDDYWGFLMLGGISGGGMGMFVNPDRYEQHKQTLLQILQETREEMKAAMPFAMNPVVYNFEINHKGTFSALLQGNEALMPDAYYGIQLPQLVKQEAAAISYIRRAEVDLFTLFCEQNGKAYPLLRTVISNLFRVSDPASQTDRGAEHQKAKAIKEENGFDFIQHEHIREELQKGHIGLARNRLSAETVIEDVADTEVLRLAEVNDTSLGISALQNGKVGVLTLAAGVGSRWTKGAGVIKALHPFAEFGDRHRSFLELHLAKTARVAKEMQAVLPHLIATSYLTHAPIAQAVAQWGKEVYPGPIYLSAGRSIGQRFVPMVRDLRFLWEEMPQEMLDENKQKVREAVRQTLMVWAKSKGEGADYEDNVANQRFSPLGHWYEVSNLLRNGTLARVLAEHPGLETIMLHNIDTLGADLDPAALTAHLQSGAALTFEVIARRMDDTGGGLARVNGRPRLLEGLAQPHEEDELRLRFYNTMTTWIQVDALLELFGLTRQSLQTANEETLSAAVRKVAQRMPTYVTIKEVKYRWGHGQEDVYPVAQIEKLWSDMSGLPDVPCAFLVVPRLRGQQMKDIAQLDEWVNDGSRDHIRLLSGLQ